MDKKLRETTNLFVEVINSKRQVMGKTWSRGTNSRLLFDVKVMLNLSIVPDAFTLPTYPFRS